MSDFTWRADDPAWIDDLFARIRKKVQDNIRRLSFASVAAKEESDDVTQNVLLAFWKYLPNFDYRNEAQLFGLISKMTENTIISMHNYWYAECRKVMLETGVQSNFFAHEHAPEGRSPSSIASSTEEAARLEVAKALLSPEDRQILFLVDEAGKSYAEVGDMVGLKPDAVRMRRTRAVDYLTKKMTQLEEGQIAAAYGE